MYCRKHKAILSTKICILRQDIADEKKKGEENLTTFSKCYNCVLGKKIRMNPKPELDKDVRKLLTLYMPKPTKYDFKLIWAKPIRFVLTRPKKYNLKGE